MPRGQSKALPVLASVLGSGRGGLRAQWTPGPEPSPEEHRRTIETTVGGFADAWFMGDSAAMMRCLHPDYVHRLVSIDGRGEPASELLRSAVGVQGEFGRLTPLGRRHQEVRILDVRQNSASAVAVVGDWILQLHLGRAGGQWSIVNVMWELAG